MTELILGAKIINVLTSYGANIILSSLSTIGKSTLRLTTHIATLDNPYLCDVKKKLEDLDIEAKIKIISALEESLNNDKLQKHVIVALSYVVQTLEAIEKEVDEIYKRIQYHETKYFSSWRSLNCKDLLNNLEKHCKKLDDRIDIFFKVYKN